MAETLLDVLLGPHCRQELVDAFGPLGDAASWVSVLAGLHDLGKFSPTFQGLREDIAAESMGPVAAVQIRRLVQWKRSGARTDCHHGVLTVVHWLRILRSWGAVPAAARSIAWALGGHHGVIPRAASVQQARQAVGDNGGPRWAAGCDHLVRRVVELWGLPEPEGLPWHEVRLSPEAVVGLAGLTSVSDWIASARAEEDYVGTDVDLASYLVQARQVEVKKVERLAWRPWRPAEDTRFRSLFAEERTPHPVQVAVEDVVSRMRGPGIVVVAAPTGEGKTKAALQAAATLVRRFGLRGFYVAMPSRVTSNQAFDVVDQLLHGQEAPPVRLLHSTAGEYLKARSAEADAAEAVRPVGVDVDGGRDGDGDAAEWFAHKRGLLAPLGVGTVDQALMAALRSSHVFVRLSGLSGKVVVFDEVHGYDVHMSTLMDRLLWWLGKMRVPVVLLSATLPARRQHTLVESWRAGASGEMPHEPSLSELHAGAYPRVTWADTETHAAETVDVEASSLNADRVVELVRVDFEERAEWAVQQACLDRCVAVVHNVVQHAVDAYEQIVECVDQLPSEERPEVFLLHGQLLQAHRARVETQIRTKFGRPDDRGTAERPLRAIVVGTQLLEGGLDVDFDVMISALAPIDSLIQRMGRIQRHRRGDDRPGLLMALTGVEEKRKKIAFPPYTTHVYAESVLLRTWALLRNRTRLNCPHEVQQLVDLVYGPGEALECPQGWEDQWVKAAGQLGRSIARKEENAQAVRLPQPRDDVQLWELTAKATGAGRTRQESYRRDEGR